MWGLIGSVLPWSEQGARERLLAGHPPRRMSVRGRLILANCEALEKLPDRLEASAIDLSGCVNLRRLPRTVRAAALVVSRTSVFTLPAGLQIARALVAEDCPKLQAVEAIRVSELSVRSCKALEFLAEGLTAERLVLNGCTSLRQLPKSIVASVVHFDISNCDGFTALPDNFARLQTLDISGCSNLAELPDGIRIRSRIEVAGSAIRQLPWSLKSVRISWRGMEVPDRIAFDPESITIEDILTERNVTLRSILLDRMAIESFVKRSRAIVADVDCDRGGERRLLRIPFERGQDFVCLDVRCPSTRKQYFLRVPPDVRTCRQAAAWMAGFRNPTDYQPMVET
jgi:hypothetical protein